MFLRLAYVLAALLVALTYAPVECVAAETSVPANAASSNQISSILLHRSGCYGRCPIYEVDIKQDGLVTFDGHRFVDSLGKSAANVSPLEFRKLVARLNDIGFFKLNERYRYEQDGCTTWWSDQPTVDIVVTRGGVKKHVSYYYGCKGPAIAEKIDALSNEIDRITDTQKWIGGGGRARTPPNQSSKRTREKPRAA
jgi:hypothetical protein